MGILDRLRSGLRSIGERLHILKGKVPEDARKEISSIERKVDRMEKEIAPRERTIIERSLEAPSAFEPKRFHVVIKYRPVISGKATRTFDGVITADSSLEAIAIAKSRLEEEPDWYSSADADETDEPEDYGSEGPTRGT